MKSLPLEKQVASLEPMKELVELGLKVESYFMWVDYLQGQETYFVLDHRHVLNECGFEKYPALTVAELFNLLRSEEQIIITCHEDGTSSVRTKGVAVIGGQTLADALAMVLEYRINEGIVTIEELNK